MKTIRLSVLERLLLPELLPCQGGKIEMLLCDSIVRQVEFSAHEISDFGLRDGGDGNVSWTNSVEVGFEFTAEQVEVLKNASKKADEGKMVSRQNLTLIVKIDSL